MKPTVLKLIASPRTVKEISKSFVESRKWSDESIKAAIIDLNESGKTSENNLNSAENETNEQIKMVTEEVLADKNRSLFECQFTKYIIINPKSVIIIHLMFKIPKTVDIYSDKFIGKLIRTYRNLNNYLSHYKEKDSIICASDAHTNIVQFLCPYVYAERLPYRHIGDFIRNPSGISPVKTDITVVNLGDYLLRSDTRIYKKLPYLIRYLNGEILRYVYSLKRGQDIFLCGNHDEEIVRAGILKPLYTYERTIGETKYFFTHAPFKKEIHEKILAERLNPNDLNECHFYLYQKFWHSTGMNLENIKENLDEAIDRVKALAPKDAVLIFGHEYCYHFVDIKPSIFGPQTTMQTCLGENIIDNFIAADKSRIIKPGCVLCTDSLLAATTYRFLGRRFHPYLDKTKCIKYGKMKKPKNRDLLNDSINTSTIEADEPQKTSDVKLNVENVSDKCINVKDLEDTLLHQAESLFYPF